MGARGMPTSWLTRGRTRGALRVRERPAAAAMINEGRSCFFTKIDYRPRDKFPPITKAHRSFVLQRATAAIFIFMGWGRNLFYWPRARYSTGGTASCCSAAPTDYIKHVCVHNVLGLLLWCASSFFCVLARCISSRPGALMILGFSTALCESFIYICMNRIAQQYPKGCAETFFTGTNATDINYPRIYGGACTGIRPTATHFAYGSRKLINTHI